MLGVVGSGDVSVMDWDSAGNTSASFLSKRKTRDGKCIGWPKVRSDFSITFVMTFKRVQSAVDHLFQSVPQPGLELAHLATGETLCLCVQDLWMMVPKMSSSGTPPSTS